jgi:hypothetical protein
MALLILLSSLCADRALRSQRLASRSVERRRIRVSVANEVLEIARTRILSLYVFRPSPTVLAERSQSDVR